MAAGDRCGWSRAKAFFLTVSVSEHRASPQIHTQIHQPCAAFIETLAMPPVSVASVQSYSTRHKRAEEFPTKHHQTGDGANPQKRNSGKSHAGGDHQGCVSQSRQRSTSLFSPGRPLPSQARARGCPSHLKQRVYRQGAHVCRRGLAPIGPRAAGPVGSRAFFWLGGLLLLFARAVGSGGAEGCPGRRESRHGVLPWRMGGSSGLDSIVVSAAMRRRLAVGRLLRGA